MAYDLPARSVRLPGAVQYDCPLSTCVYNFCLPLSDEQLGITLTMRLWGANSEEMQVGAEQMQAHIKTHAPWEFMDSAAKEEQDFETAIGAMNEKITNADRDNARAWENTRSAQESLQAARTELVRTQARLGNHREVLDRVWAALEETRDGLMPGAEWAQEYKLAQRLLEMLPPKEHDHHYLSTGCLHGDHAYCQRSTGAAGAKTPAQCKFCSAPCICSCHNEKPFKQCSSTVFCVNWGFCHRCHPRLTEVAAKHYKEGPQQSSWGYQRAVHMAAQDLGIPEPVRPEGDADVPS